MSEERDRLEHDTLDDAMRSGTVPTAKTLLPPRAAREDAEPVSKPWLSIDNPAIWEGDDED